jgi:hypothetical protein
MSEVVAIKVHHLVPGRHEIPNKHRLRVAAGIDFRKRSKLGVGTENQVDNGARPLEFAARPVAPLLLIVAHMEPIRCRHNGATRLSA